MRVRPRDGIRGEHEVTVNSLDELSRRLWREEGVPFDWAVEHAPNGFQAVWDACDDVRSMVAVYCHASDYAGLVRAVRACIRRVVPLAPAPFRRMAEALEGWPAQDAADELDTLRDDAPHIDLSGPADQANPAEHEAARAVRLLAEIAIDGSHKLTLAHNAMDAVEAVAKAALYSQYKEEDGRGRFLNATRASLADAVRGELPQAPSIESLRGVQ